MEPLLTIRFDVIRSLTLMRHLRRASQPCSHSVLMPRPSNTTTTTLTTITTLTITTPTTSTT